MSIHPYLKDAVFDPTAIDAMALAFDNACMALQVAPDAQIVREIIAKQVIELARRGEREPEKLEEAICRSVRSDEFIPNPID
jgi:hypothetical protein